MTIKNVTFLDRYFTTKKTAYTFYGDGTEVNEVLLLLNIFSVACEVAK
jgi:hypothetical protein